MCLWLCGINWPGVGVLGRGSSDCIGINGCQWSKLKVHPKKEREIFAVLTVHWSSTIVIHSIVDCNNSNFGHVHWICSWTESPDSRVATDGKTEGVASNEIGFIHMEDGIILCTTWNWLWHIYTHCDWASYQSWWHLLAWYLLLHGGEGAAVNFPYISLYMHPIRSHLWSLIVMTSLLTIVCKRNVH